MFHCPVGGKAKRVKGGTVMDEQPGANLEEEPQEERGPMGSRDAGSAKPAGGPADRPAGKADKKADTSIQPQDAQDPDAPYLQQG
jgi:hypothetical protein